MVENKDLLFKRLDELESEYIDFLIDICNIESPTEYKEGVDNVGKYIIEKAKNRGWEIEVQKQKISGDAICITMNPDASESPICFSAHMDTVHPIGLFGYPPTRRDDEKLYGPGMVDCKGGIASSFMAMAALEDIGFTKRPVKLILQSDEENSSRNSNKTTIDFMCEKAKGSVAFLNCEGYIEGKFGCSRKGIRKYRFEVKGNSVHSAVCYKGSSAIVEAAHKIIELEKMKSADGITCNCGLINGGSAENTVPESCTFTADFRFRTSEQMEEITRFAEEIANKSFVEGTSCTLTLASWRYPMELKEENLDLLGKINDIFTANGIKKHEVYSGNGGSDAADITHYGIPCLDDFGVWGGGEHSVREYIKITSLKESAQRLSLIALNI